MSRPAVHCQRQHNKLFFENPQPADRPSDAPDQFNMEMARFKLDPGDLLLFRPGSSTAQATGQQVGLRIMVSLNTGWPEAGCLARLLAPLRHLPPVARSRRAAGRVLGQRLAARRGHGKSGPGRRAVAAAFTGDAVLAARALVAHHPSWAGRSGSGGACRLPIRSARPMAFKGLAQQRPVVGVVVAQEGLVQAGGGARRARCPRARPWSPAG